MGTYSTIPHKLRVCKNSILSYTKCRSENDLVLLLCCTELTKHLHHGIWQHVTFTLLLCLMSFYHGQILIETETDSYTICNILRIQDGDFYLEYQNSETRFFHYWCLDKNETSITRRTLPTVGAQKQHESHVCSHFWD